MGKRGDDKFEEMCTTNLSHFVTDLGELSSAVAHFFHLLLTNKNKALFRLVQAIQTPLHLMNQCSCWQLTEIKCSSHICSDTRNKMGCQSSNKCVKKSICFSWHVDSAKNIGFRTLAAISSLGKAH